MVDNLEVVRNSRRRRISKKKGYIIEDCIVYVSFRTLRIAFASVTLRLGVVFQPQYLYVGGAKLLPSYF